MKDELRSMNKFAFAELRHPRPASKPAAMATVQPCRAEAAAAKVEKKSEKSEKWFFAIFQLQPAAAQVVPTKIGCGNFSDFSKNSRGYTGGGPPSRPPPNLNLNRNLNLNYEN
jgi:hypothetical protein